MIFVVDYGVGNLGAIANMLKKIGVASRISGDPAELAQAEKVILPGVGAFDVAMERIEQSGLRPVLERKAREEKVPFLGICLGMQLLTRSSEEGTRPGLGWVPARTLAFRGRVDNALKVPHMGWNVVEPASTNPLLDAEARFYFVHSYFVEVEDPCHSLLRCRHGLPFEAGIQHGNIYGVQFHPEKSHRFGKQLLGNFARL